MRRFAFACLVAFTCLAAAALLLPQTARAEDVIRGITPAKIAELLKAAGYRAEVVPGKPMAHVRTGVGGHTVLVLLLDCGQTFCSAVQFYAGFRKVPKFTPAFTDRWNSQRRYGRAYLNPPTGDLRIEYDIDLHGGVAATFIKQGVTLFEMLLTQLDEFIRTEPETPDAPAGDIAGKGKDAETLTAEGKFIDAAAALDEAANALWDRAPLAFRRALWVTEPPEGFGIYDPRESSVYRSGGKMIAYAEPIGFAWRQFGDVYQTDLVVDIVVKDKAGAELLRRDEFQGMKLGSRVRNHEFMATFTYSFDGIPPGEYVLDTIIRDLAGGKSGTFSLPFTVR